MLYRIFQIEILLLLAFLCFTNCDFEDCGTCPPLPENLYLTWIHDLTLTVDYPSDSLHVENNFTVRGEVSDLPIGHTIHVFVYPLGCDAWYPQSPTVTSNHTWSTSVHLGGTGTFHIGAMVVKDEQERIINQDLSGNTKFYIHNISEEYNCVIITVITP